MHPNLYALELLEHFGEIISCYLENLHKWYTEVRVFFFWATLYTSIARTH